MSHVCAYSGPQFSPSRIVETSCREEGGGVMDSSLITQQYGFSSMKFRIFKDRKKEWRWTLHARNGKKIATAGEGYKRRTQCTKMIAKIILGPHKIIE